MSLKECKLVGCKEQSYSKDLCKKHYNKQWLYGDARMNGRLYRRKTIDYNITSLGCFECTSHVVNRGGYTEYHFNNRKYLLHRYVYEECFGEIPEGMIVRHKCDNRLCINPEHLELGTHQDNMKDMVNRDRQCRGEKSPFAKLSEKDIPDIRILLQNGVTQSEIALKYNVSRTTVGYIKRNKTWSHVR